MLNSIAAIRETASREAEDPSLVHSDFVEARLAQIGRLVLPNKGPTFSLFLYWLGRRHHSNLEQQVITAHVDLVKRGPSREEFARYALVYMTKGSGRMLLTMNFSRERMRQARAAGKGHFLRWGLQAVFYLVSEFRWDRAYLQKWRVWILKLRSLFLGLVKS